MDTIKYDSILKREQFLEGIQEAKKTARDKAAKLVESLTVERDILFKTEKVFKHLIDKLAKKDLDQMDRLVTYGLKTVFPDKDICFKTELGERGKRVTVNLNTIHRGNIVDPDSQSSIHVIESFLLRLLCVRKLKRAPILLMDETFAAVDAQYIDNVCQLVGQLASKLGIDILLVTHNIGFADSVHNTYRIFERNNTVGIEKVK